MRRPNVVTESLFTLRKLENLVPRYHLLRPIRYMVNTALLKMATLFSDMYAVDANNKRRLDIWANCHQWFANLEKTGKVRRPTLPRECGHNAHIYYLLLPNLVACTALIDGLKAKGIHTVFHYVPLHSLPRGQTVGRAVGDMSHTNNAGDRLVRLPMWLGLVGELANVITEVVASTQQ